jgi:1-deoxy-D-xylulose-5-phosphate reductoisomerase
MTARPARLIVLGSTGSIGTQTLDVIERLRAAGRPLQIVGLSAGENLEELIRQIRRHTPECVSISSEGAAKSLKAEFPGLEVLHGLEAPAALVDRVDAEMVVNALVGAVGLKPTLVALEKGRTVALANKESLVVGGELVTAALASGNGRLLPVDSEHNAVFQCLQAGRRNDLRRVILTASGGPFRNLDPAALNGVTVTDALAHPTWSMGPRITIDSATMVNKAFEVIEAHYLFGLPYDQIDVVLHPESIIHSQVEFTDGSIVAELATHDMRIPIQYALTYPERPSTGLPRLDLHRPLNLHLQPMDETRYPAFAVVLAAARAGGTAPATVNAADEVLVSRFLAGEIRFTGIAHGLASVLKQWHDEIGPEGRELRLERLLEVDAWARRTAGGLPLPQPSPLEAKEAS